MIKARWFLTLQYLLQVPTPSRSLDSQALKRPITYDLLRINALSVQIKFVF